MFWIRTLVLVSFLFTYLSHLKIVIMMRERTSSGPLVIEKRRDNGVVDSSAGGIIRQEELDMNQEAHVQRKR